ncbi:MAG: hypothetical protein M1816_000060 [Peltula sp. TS41687]|nr:MAG: hypothetical protein M1816_000060 [Peltula sp. TS41687]
MCQYVLRANGRYQQVGYCHLFLATRDRCHGPVLVEPKDAEGLFCVVEGEASSYRRVGHKARPAWLAALAAPFNEIRYRYREWKWEFDDHRREKKVARKLRQGKWVQYTDRWGVVQTCDA